VKRFLTKTRRAAVLGCGPAGLFAAHALVQKGWDVSIYSRKRRSEMYGSQYLHHPIPGLVDEKDSRTISYVLRGSVADYRQKVYGGSTIRVSPETLPPTHPGWDIRAAYYKAFDLYRDLIVDVPSIDPGFLGVVGGESGRTSPVSISGLRLDQFDQVISSLPAPVLCHRPMVHQFLSQDVWAIGDAPERGIFSPVGVADDTVICDGTRGIGWYRASKIFGYSSAEWPGGKRPPISNIAPVSKPVATDCDCFIDNREKVSVIRVGRYGTWTKGVLAHHAYQEAWQL
jgi:hypothetical protein